MKLTLRIPGVPQARPRPKVTTIGGFARMYQPGGAAKKHFELVKQIAEQQWGGNAPLDCPVSVICEYVFPRQTSKIWKTKAMPRYKHITKPDRDNLDKLVLDALESANVVCNDSRVWDGHSQKWHAAVDEQPHTVVTVITGTTEDTEEKEA